MVCTSCKYSICEKCITSAFSACEKAACLKCKVEYLPSAFTFLGPKFKKEVLTEMRTNVLFAIEQSRMPHTMDIIAATRARDAAKLEHLTAEYKYAMESAKNDSVDRPLKRTKTEQQFVLQDKRGETRQALALAQDTLSALRGDEDWVSTVMPVCRCSTDVCGGIIMSDTFACAACMVSICPDCYAQLSATSAHVCEPSMVATIAHMKAEAKPCPKCATPITRAWGCNTMFCTACKTSYDEVTRAILTKNLHNPEREEWLKTLPVAAPVEGVCTTYDDWVRHGSTITSSYTNRDNAVEVACLMTVLHSSVLLHEMPAGSVPPKSRAIDNRIDFVMGRMTEAAFRAVIAAQDMLETRNERKAQCSELFTYTVDRVMPQWMSGVTTTAGALAIFTDFFCVFNTVAEKLSKELNCSSVRLHLYPPQQYGKLTINLAAPQTLRFKHNSDGLVCELSMGPGVRTSIQLTMNNVRGVGF